MLLQSIVDHISTDLVKRVKQPQTAFLLEKDKGKRRSSRHDQAQTRQAEAKRIGERRRASYLCTSSMCAFSVDSSTGVLSRKGGAECGAPGCGFLSFSGMGITAIGDGAFAGMVHLTVLDLSSNSLTSISHGDLKDLTSLKTLNIRSNKLAELYNGTFQGLSLLESLSLEYNSLTSIEAGAFQGLSSLPSLSLRSNSLSAIRSGTFEGLSQLRELDLSDNALGDLTAVGAFSGMPELRTLNMQGQRANQWHIANGTFSGIFSNLTWLDLSRNLDHEWWQYTGGYWGSALNMRSTIELGAFDTLTGLEHLDLSYAKLGDGDGGLPAGLFLQCRSLRSLYLHNNLMSTIADYAFAGLGSLALLHLHGNGLRTITDYTFAGLEDSLSTLYLQHNQIRSISNKAFCGFRGLSDLRLYQNSLSVLPVNVFMFTNMTTYIGIDLGSNPLICKPGSSSNIQLYGLGGSDLPSCPSEVSFDYFGTPRYVVKLQCKYYIMYQ